MKVEKVYNLLEKLKKCSPEINKKSRRLLKYIYHDVYLDCFEREKKEAVDRVVADGAQIGSMRYNDVVKPYDENKKRLSIFLDGDESILSYYLEMIDDKDERFINLFFDKVNTYFDIVDNHFYTDEDFKTYSFIFNIYSMLKAYHEHKDNFDIYSKIVEDCSFLIDCSGFNSRYSSWFENLSKRKKEIDIIIECDFYLEIEKVRSLLKDDLKKISSNYTLYYDGEIEQELALMNSIFNDYIDLKGNVSSDKLISLDTVISKCTFKKYNRGYCSFYCKSLLIGDRLDYINDKLPFIFNNVSYRNSAFEVISVLDYQLFEYLNKMDQYKEKDSFISCMDIVFNSDTYYEFNSKIKALKNATDRYVQGDKEAAVELVNSLDDIKHKKVIDDKIISFDVNTMKPVYREKSIFSRMLTLYGEFYSGTGLNIERLMYQVGDDVNLFNFDSHLTFKIEEELKIIEVAKKAEERRQAEIKIELEEMARIQTEYEEKKDVQTVVDPSQLIENLQEDTESDTKTEEKQVSSEGRSFQKLKSIFGKKN